MKQADRVKRNSDGLRIYVMAFTAAGLKTAERLSGIFSQWQDAEARFFAPARIMEAADDLEASVAARASGEPAEPSAFSSSSLAEFTSLAFAEADHIIYIGAAGIAVRAVAPHIKSKDTDPGVIVVDEKAAYVIPILSGHIGGANALALDLARELGAQAVITTATDVNGVIAIDSWATENCMKIDRIGNIKHISSAVLENRKVKVYTQCRGSFAGQKAHELTGLYQDFEALESLDSPNPPESSGSDVPLVVITDSHSLIKDVRKRFPEALVLIPCVTFAGMGCRKDIDFLPAEELFDQALTELDLDVRAIRSLNSVDLKKDEKALLMLAEKYGIEFNTFSAEELMEAELYTDAEMSHSELVSRVAGAGNVCERAAVMGAIGSPAYAELKSQTLIADEKSGWIDIIMKKTKRNGVTIAVSCI